MKKRKRKLSPLLSGLVMVLCLLICGFCALTIVSDVRNFLNLQTSIQAAETEYSELQKQRDELLQAKQNLTNPDYLEHYVRGKFLVTRDGEKIFKFPSIDRDEPTDSAGAQ